MGSLLNDLENLYYDVQESESFTSAKTIHESLKWLYPNVTLKFVKNWLKSQRTSQTYKPLRHKYQRNPIVSKDIDHIWNIDLVEVMQPDVNDNVRNLLCVIDNLSKFAWVRKLQNKKKETVVNSLNNVIESSGRKPHIIGADYGIEFTNNHFRNYVDSQNIRLYLNAAPLKATLVERFNQTLKIRLFRYMFYHNTNRFIDILDQVVTNYNNTIHSRTKFPPAHVGPGNQKMVYRNLYGNRYKKQEKQKFVVGDRVLIPYYVDLDPTKMRAKYRRTKYKPEDYVIEKVLFTSPRYKYVVRKVGGDKLRNTYYADQLVHITDQVDPHVDNADEHE